MKLLRLLAFFIIPMGLIIAAVPQNKTKPYKLTADQLLGEANTRTQYITPETVADMIIKKDPSCQLIDVRNKLEGRILFNYHIGYSFWCNILGSCISFTKQLICCKFVRFCFILRYCGNNKTHRNYKKCQKSEWFHNICFKFLLSCYLLLVTCYLLLVAC